MSVLLTPAQITATAKVSQYLVQNDIDNGKLFGSRLDENWGLKLYMERKAIEWMTLINSSDISLRGTSDYLFSLCFKTAKAQKVVNGGGGGTITPITPTISVSPSDFTVDDSTLIPTYGTTVTIPTYIGHNLLFIRGGIAQSINNIGASYYSWDKITGIFTCSPAASLGEQFQLYPFI